MSEYKLVPVARAIWEIRREWEDRCDMELEDLSPDHSVWSEAKAALEAMLDAAPSVQGEPVAIVCDFSEGRGPQPTFVEAEVGGKSVSFEWRDRPDGLKELLVPQSVTPDVAGLVDALELIEKGEGEWGAFRWKDCHNIAVEALAAYRKGSSYVA